MVKKKKDNGIIKYKIPKEYKDLINDKFLEIFYTELGKKFRKEFDLQEIIDKEEEVNIEGTGGWWEALKTTCKKTKNQEMLKYYKSLWWYDSDWFDGELGDMLSKKYKKKR